MNIGQGSVVAAPPGQNSPHLRSVPLLSMKASFFTIGAPIVTSHIQNVIGSDHSDAGDGMTTRQINMIAEPWEIWPDGVVPAEASARALP